MNKSNKEYENKIKQLMGKECDTKTLAELKSDKIFSGIFGGVFGGLTLTFLVLAVITQISFPGFYPLLVPELVFMGFSGLGTSLSLRQFFKYRKEIKKARKMIEECNNELEQIKLERELNKDNQTEKNLTKNVVKNNETVEKNENKSNKTI